MPDTQAEPSGCQLVIFISNYVFAISKERQMFFYPEVSVQVLHVCVVLLCQLIFQHVACILTL